MTPSVLRRRLPAAVNRGAALLDEREPGWAEKVKLTTLDLANPYACVLGQVHGYYSDGRTALGLSPDDARRFGFNVPIGAGTFDAWADLDVLWRDAIRQRRTG